MRPLLVIVVSVAMLLGACNRGEDESVQTTASSGTSVTAQAPASTPPSSTAAPIPGAGESTTAATTAVVVGIPSYEVVSALAAEGGEALVIVIEPGAYSNVELENLVFDIVDRFAPSTVLIVDVREAADLTLLAALTDEEEMFLAQHTLITIENGVEVTFLGPYADIPGLTIGS